MTTDEVWQWFLDSMDTDERTTAINDAYRAKHKDKRARYNIAIEYIMFIETKGKVVIDMPEVPQWM